MSEVKRCRHGRVWIIFSGHGLWCYECGALRYLRPIKGTNESVPASSWVRPTGPGGKNPYNEGILYPKEKRG